MSLFYALLVVPSPKPKLFCPDPRGSPINDQPALRLREVKGLGYIPKIATPGLRSPDHRNNITATAANLTACNPEPHFVISSSLPGSPEIPPIPIYSCAKSGIQGYKMVYYGW